MLKLDEPFRNQEIFIISLFFNSSDPHGSTFFAVQDPDPGSQNLADPDPKHWYNVYYTLIFDNKSPRQGISIELFN